MASTLMTTRFLGACASQRPVAGPNKEEEGKRGSRTSQLNQKAVGAFWLRRIILIVWLIRRRRGVGVEVDGRAHVGTVLISSAEKSILTQTGPV